MRTIFGNNCSKGCLIYVVALVALLVVAAMGLDGLRARFGGAQVQGIKPPEYTIQSTGNSPPASTGNQQASNPADVVADGGGGLPTPTVGIGSVPPPPVSSPLPVSTPAPSQAQGGTIQGEAGTSFHIIQSGDTLWSISVRFGVEIDDLRALNNLSDDIIYPGQVLYLPAPGAPASTPPTAPQTGTGSDQDEPTSIPSMPNTGIIKKP
ncbi:MAG: LysM peptidoglycan-binding domain-containing protein [Chloroflexia bacterium]